ncbi:cell adhesion molecule 2-like [Lepisosteus oculatus]|uniref:cell adhesion molecule 2-like n=1 Tax=Lepisosteus oculatus TaxID=7918 RepID=UPI00073FC064|nr:PREDICTED: small cell adhesion glycoprotein-like isoform X2 [Lepisosteus oculatus]XP_015199510.1 PREDICTED: small cell adhesion glycoprotein-like isoform X2 [Lepisosteus oculatus]XP_015199511.1 PREDICTED: small cell adhesion glycoprotein-like isoform X2 [Lepisosteus oculatus]XP_015199512.1 PREDICTED: small cell adhesion glycoprotein-like isoform X2 [Lepisosteus oculatus]XP_015199513.1 PREDICTED: small cell adhesion glycoprotein-like isoform X2 [Lepisosteus oculatus]
MTTQTATTLTVPEVTTPQPAQTDSTVIGVVIVLVLLTLAGAAYLLFRYQCQNKGAYRTTGEPAPGEELEQVAAEASPEDKKEYFI